MHTRYRLIAIGLLCSTAAVFPAFTAKAEGAGVHWPSFRGPRATGVADGFDVPATWDVGTGQNVRWKTAIPGLGLSSPVVWGDRVFVTTAISGLEQDELKIGLYGDIAPVKDESVHRFMVYCLDKNTGEILWERKAYEGVPKVKRHPKSSHASSTMATDGKHAVAFFGSEGLYAYDMKGKLLWSKDLGTLRASFFMVPDAEWGYGASPVIHDGRVIVQCDVIGDSFLAALDVKTGKEIWRVKREDYPTWSTPTVVEHGGKTLVLVNGFKHIGAYDFATGKEVWKLSGRGDIPIPTPFVAHDLVFITNSHGATGLWAIRPGASGDISLKDEETSNAGVAWSATRDGAYMPTPIVYGDLLYVGRDNGVLGVYRAATGEELYRERLGSGKTGFTASAVAGDGKIFITAEDGDVKVVKHGTEFELLATNSMDEIVMATPAISEGLLLFRTRGHVVAIGSKEGKKK